MKTETKINEVKELHEVVVSREAELQVTLNVREAALLQQLMVLSCGWSDSGDFGILAERLEGSLSSFVYEHGQNLAYYTHKVPEFEACSRERSIGRGGKPWIAPKNEDDDTLCAERT